MRELFSLGPRLSKCAQYVREGVKFADIGSDHGYLPIWLMLQGRVKSAIAADIGEGPLSSAQRNAVKYHCEIKTILSDGFKKVPSEEVEDAVIAGMGGGLMINIITEAPWLRENGRHLILQPMTMVPELRMWLACQGFAINKEEAVMDEGKVYSVMSVAFDPENSKLTELEFQMGKIVPGSEFSREYAVKVLKKLSDKIKGFTHKGKAEEAEKIKALSEKIESLYLK